MFGNADGAYGANVNQLIDSGRWDDEDELAETYTRRKCFAYGRDGHAGAAGRAAAERARRRRARLPEPRIRSSSASPRSITTSTRSAASAAPCKRAKGGAAPVYIGDQTRGEGKVRTLAEQVALETRTRMLNPKWYEGMLKHGYEGVRQIEAHVTNTMGWSATTGQVAPWVYQQLTETFVLDDDDARAPRRAQSRRPRRRSRTGCSKRTSATTGRRTPRRSTRCGAPAKNSKTGSKALRVEVAA